MTISTVRKFGVGVASIAMVAGLAGPALAIEKPAPLNGGWDRIASDRVNNDRIDTAIAVAQFNYTKPSEPQAVYIANAKSMVDSATAGQLTDGPILLVDENSRTLDVVKNEVQRYTSATTVYAIGGTTVVSDAALKAVAGDKNIARLGGKDRYETAMAVAKRVLEISPEKSKNLMVANGMNPIDALAAGPLDFGPMVYVDSQGMLPKEVTQWVKDKHVENVLGLGGKAVVPDKALSDAMVPELKVNPGTVDEDRIKARAAFEAARALYLGVNKYSDDDVFAPVKSYGIASSRNPKLDQVARSDSDQRFEGYKALATEVANRVDIADSAASELKNQITNLLKTAKDAHKTAWNTFVTDTTYGVVDSTSSASAAEPMGKLLLALYGKKVAGDHAEKLADKKYFILDSDEKVTGVNYGEIERSDKFQKQLKDDTKRIKAFFETKNEALLGSGTDSDAGIDNTVDAGTQSNNLFTPTNTILTLANVSSNNAGTNPVVLLQKDSALFLRVAQNNADSTKLMMDQAWAKVQASRGYTRLGGADRYATSAMISQYMRTKKTIDRVYLANGESMADALVAGVFSQGPILLVNSAGTLADPVKTELGYIGRYKSVNGDKPTYRAKGQYPTVFAIGGKKALADNTAAAAATLVKEGNDGVPDQSMSLLITKNPYTVGNTTTMSNNGSVTLAAQFQPDSKLSGDKLEAQWQYYDNSTTSWKNVEASQPSTFAASYTPADGLTKDSGTGLTQDSDSNIYTTKLTITGASTVSAAAKFRVVVSYKATNGVIDKQVASSEISVANS